MIQGGTFYDGAEAYYDEYDYNRPQPTRYDSENNIENNFRDFADIKNDLLKYDQGYVPRYWNVTRRIFYYNMTIQCPSLLCLEYCEKMGITI